MIYEKELSAGKFYLYSDNGNHRFVGQGGSVTSATIAADGEMLGIISADYIIQIYRMHDGSLYKCVALAEHPPKRDYGPMRNKINKILTEQADHILNR
jgi:hypothetical protein